VNIFVFKVNPSSYSCVPTAALHLQLLFVFIQASFCTYIHCACLWKCHL